jgi:hypothetical protein
MLRMTICVSRRQCSCNTVAHADGVPIRQRGPIDQRSVSIDRNLSRILPQHGLHHAEHDAY